MFPNLGSHHCFRVPSGNHQPVQRPSFSAFDKYRVQGWASSSAWGGEEWGGKVVAKKMYWHNWKLEIRKCPMNLNFVYKVQLTSHS